MLSVSVIICLCFDLSCKETCLANFGRIIFRVVEENRIYINRMNRVLEHLIVAVLVNECIRIQIFLVITFQDYRHNIL